MKQRLLRLIPALVLLLCLSTLSAGAVGYFTDVPADDWYVADLNEMVAYGIIAGYEDGSFRPTESVTTGAILKMIAMMSGSGEQPAAAGAHWAQGYHDYAYYYGWIDEQVWNLDAPASRQFVADVLFGQLRMVADYRLASPFVDTNNAVVATLNDMGIVAGSQDPATGQFYFYPDAAISRAETCVLLGNSMDYTETVLGISDFRYQHPVAGRPYQAAEPTVEYFIDIFTYMLVHDVPDLDVTFSNLGGDTFNNLFNVYDVRSMIFDAFVYVQDAHHELGSFYTVQGDSTTGNTESATISLYIGNDMLNVSDAQLFQYQTDALLLTQDYAEQLYANGIVYQGMSQTDMAYAFYQQVALDFAYDLSLSPMSYNALGMYTNRIGVCQSYVAIFNVLCEMSGIPAQGVSGQSSGENHIWSLIQVDGISTYVDPTWADPTPDQPGYCDPAWFGLSIGQLIATHTFDPIYEGKVVTLG